MAVPTVSTISPATGSPTGGQLVEVLGTGFRLPTAPPSTIPAPVAPPSVRVLVGGVSAPRVDVISDTRLLLEIPKRSMPIGSDGQTTLGTELVPLTVENIDDTGVLIPGETVTVADAYTYQRPGVGYGDGPYSVTRVTALLIDLLRSEVLANTVLETSTDYDPNTNTTRIEPQATPQLILTGPELAFNAFFTFRGSYIVPGINPGEGYRKRRHRVVDLSYEIIGVTNSTLELNNLIELLEVVVDRNVELDFECTPGAGDFIKLELRWVTDPSYERQGNDPGLISDLRVFRGTVQVVGLPLVEIAGVDQDAIQEVGFEVDVTTLEAPQQIGENLPTAQGAPTRSPPDQHVPPPPPFGTQAVTRSPAGSSTTPQLKQGAPTRSPGNTGTAPMGRPSGPTRSPSEGSTGPDLTFRPTEGPTRSPPDSGDQE